MISSSSLLESRLNSSTTRSDPDTEAKVRSTIRCLNDSLQSNANEPSLAFYRIQEHIRKTLPTLTQKREELEHLHERVHGLIFDVEYSVDAVKSLSNCDEHLNNITTSLEKSLYLSKQINLLKQQQLQQQLLEKRDTSASN